MTPALQAAEPSAASMLRHFLKSCFHKRSSGRPPSKSSTTEGSDETDGSDPTLISLQTKTHQQQPLDLPIRNRDKAQAHIQISATAAAEQDPTMPRVSKKTKAATTSKSAKDRKPSLKAQQAARYFAEQQSHGPSDAALGALKTKLNQMFDELIPDDEKQRDASGKVLNDELDPQQCMEYIQRLGVNMASYEQFVPLEIVQSETLGIITRRGFVDGWARALAETNGGKGACDWTAQKRLVRARINQTLTDPAAYKVYYDYAFQLGKEPGQKALNMAVAVGFWEGLFEPNTHPWRTAHVDWLAQWTTYLREKFGVVKVNEDGEEEIEYKRTVSKDLWNQTRLFAAKTMQDETLGFWSEEQAWPGLIDEFVLWCREKGIVPAQNGESMQID